MQLCHHIFVSCESIEKIIPNQVEVTMTEADFKLGNESIWNYEYFCSKSLMKSNNSVLQI